MQVCIGVQRSSNSMVTGEALETAELHWRELEEKELEEKQKRELEEKKQPELEEKQQREIKDTRESSFGRRRRSGRREGIAAAAEQYWVAAAATPEGIAIARGTSAQRRWGGGVCLRHFSNCDGFSANLPMNWVGDKNFGTEGV